jgi:Transport protein particle (TRAPP) component
MSSKQWRVAGEDAWKNKTEKVVSIWRDYWGWTCLTDAVHAFQNAELFTLTYGALVVQLIKDYEDYQEVNKQLEKMWVENSPRSALKSWLVLILSTSDCVLTLPLAGGTTLGLG